VVAHTFTEPGTYRVRYRLRDNLYGRSESFIEINVGDEVKNSPPTPVLVTNSLMGQRYHTVQFDASKSFDVDSNQLSYEWDFGDYSDPINYSNTSNPQFVYNLPGSYYGNVIVKDSEGLSSTLYFTVHIIDSSQPIKNGLTAQQSPSNPLEIWLGTPLTHMSSPIEYYDFHWFFGDNEYNRGRSQDHIYSSEGTYDIQVSGYDVLGNRYSANETILINTTPFIPPIGINASNYSPNVGENITLSVDSFDISEIGDYQFVWDLGDGTIISGIGSDTSSLVHSYTENGLFMVVLNLKSPDGITTRLTANINSLNGQMPTPFFIASPIVGQSPLVVEFNGQYSHDTDDSILSYYWDWNDGERMLGQNQESHTYTIPGDYFPTLTVVDEAGNISSYQSQIIVLDSLPPEENQLPIAEISSLSPTSGVAPLTVTVDALQSRDLDINGMIIDYKWETSDGYVSSGPFYSHTFVDSGDQWISLTVTDNYGAQATANLPIFVEEDAGSSDLLYSYWPIHPLTQDSVRFAALGQGSSFLWTIDSTQYEGKVVNHTFTSDGLHSIHLEIYDENSSLLFRVSDNIKVSTPAAPVAKVEISPFGSSSYLGPNGNLVITEVPAVIEFNGQRSRDDLSPALQYHWDFADGQTSVNASGKHVFDNEGLYQIALTVTNQSGLTSTVTSIVDVQVDYTQCYQSESDSACHYINEIENDSIPLSSVGSIHLRNNLIQPYMSYNSLEPESGDFVAIVYDDGVTRPNYIDITDLVSPSGNTLQIDIQSAISRLPNVTAKYRIEVVGTNPDGSLSLNGSTPQFSFGTSSATIFLPDGQYSLDLASSTAPFVKHIQSAQGSVVLSDLPTGSYSVVGRSDSSQYLLAGFTIDQPYSQLQIEAQIIGPPGTNGLVNNSPFMATNSIQRLSSAKDAEPPENGFILPNPFPFLDKDKSSPKNTKSSISAQTVGTTTEIPIDFNRSVFSYNLTPDWTATCGVKAPFPGTTHIAGPHSNPNLINRQHVSSFTKDMPNAEYISSIEPLPPYLEEIDVICTFQGSTPSDAVDKWKAYVGGPLYCGSQDPYLWYYEWIRSLRQIREKENMYAIVHFLDAENNYIPEKVFITDSFSAYRIRAKLTNDEALTNTLMLGTGGDVSDWGAHIRHRIAVPKSILYPNPGSQNSNITGKIQLEMIPSTPYTRDDLAFRMSCFVSYPEGSPIQLTSLEMGADGTPDQPPFIPDSGQDLQIYSSNGDAKRSLHRENGLFPVDLDLTPGTSNTYWNRGGRYVPRYSFLADYDDSKIVWDSVRVFVGNESDDLLEFDLDLREDSYLNSDNPFRKDVLFSTNQSSGPISETEINTMMRSISQKYNWNWTNKDKIDQLKFSFYLVGTEIETGLTVKSGEPLEKIFNTSFNLRAGGNEGFNYVQNGCSGEYSVGMNSYVNSKMTEVVHYLRNNLEVNTLCNDASLPFGGRFSVDEENENDPTKSHKDHKRGNNLDIRYFSDQDCAAFYVSQEDEIEDGDISIKNEQEGCINDGGFENFYDRIPDNKLSKQRRRIDWDYTRTFLTNFHSIENDKIKQGCLDTPSTCPQIIAQHLIEEGTEDYDTKLARQRKVSARNFRAMKRLAKWAQYNRRKWSDLLYRFERLYIIFSYGKRLSAPYTNWQKNLIVDGKILNFDILSDENGNLAPIQGCEQDTFCYLNTGSFRKNLKNESGHYHHMHLELDQ
jgi:PKD repeat protein